MTVEVGLRFVELGVVPLGPTENTPVQITDRITRDILPVMRKLGTEPLERTAVRTSSQAFDDFTSDQLQVAELLQKLGVQVLEIG